MKRRPFRNFILVAALGTSCCAPANLGQSPEIIWWTDHETGNFSDWDTGGYHWSAGGGSAEIVTSPSPVRSGLYSLRSDVTSPGSGSQSSSGASRSGGLPTEAYYSAWYYFPEAIASTTYWVFFKFRSRTVPSDDTTKVDTWDLDVVTDSNGLMNLALYQHVGNPGQHTAATTAIPIRRWFQVEAFLRAASDNTGRITIWFDGTQVFDISGEATMPSSYIEWNVGGVSEVIAPAPATMYVDDAAVSTQRLGPDFPVFWRGQ